MQRYTVYLEDMTGRWQVGAFARSADAINAVKGLVDRFLAENARAELSPAQLYDRFVLSGPELRIVPADEPFSARTYAMRRCLELVGDVEDQTDATERTGRHTP